MTTAPMLNPKVLGQAEKAHGALFDRIVTGTNVTYHRWVALNLVAAGPEDIDRERLVETMTGALKIDEAIVRDVIGELVELHLIESTSPDGSHLQLTEDGQEEYRRIRGRVDETIGRLYAGIPADDLATAGRVLTLLTARANTELAGGPTPR
jgi:DNA-binding MarR family transcriptional regulator